MLKSKFLTVELEVEKEVEVEVDPGDLELILESDSGLVSGVEDSDMVAE